MPHVSPDASLIKGTGGFGSIFVTDTQPYAGEFFCIQVLEDCRFTTLTSTDMQNSDRFVTQQIVVPAGLVLSANFTAVTLAYGKVILYKH